MNSHTRSDLDVKLGTTTFGFRYLLEEPMRAPPLVSLVKQARDLGLDCLQVCENARPLDLPGGGWNELVQRAADTELEIQVGCLTLSPEVLFRYLELAAAVPSDTVRVVLEKEGQTKLGRKDVLTFLDAVVPRLQSAGMRLAIENHFDIPCSVLAEAVQGYPVSLVGFCVDSANSLRNFEPPGQVLDYLGARALLYHVKDYRVSGRNVGFSVSGAPLGTGDLDFAGFLIRVFREFPAPYLLVENWVPHTRDWEAGVRTDREWLQRSLENLRKAVNLRTKDVNRTERAAGARTCGRSE